MGKRRPRKKRPLESNDSESQTREDLKTRRSRLDKRRVANPYFDAYYRAQNIFPADEWPLFYEACRVALPTVVRINASRPLWRERVRRLMGDYRWKPRLWDGTEGLPLVWECSCEDYNANSDIREWCELLNRRGDVTFQELASMLPPLILDIEPSHLVLDMCAAPGSKTTQAIEHQLSRHRTFATEEEDAASASDADGAAMPTGGVISNDKDVHRCCMILQRQIRKTASPGVAVFLGDGNKLPFVRDEPNSVDWTRRPNDPFDHPPCVMFDRIMADVPCSGDGTLRKNHQIWQNWHGKNGVEMHPIQVKLLVKGLRHLKVGGKLVYSTCSLNPIENEAVLLAAIRSYTQDNPHESIAILPIPAVIPELRVLPGLTTWRVPQWVDRKVVSETARRMGAEADKTEGDRNGDDAEMATEDAQAEVKMDGGEAGAETVNNETVTYPFFDSWDSVPERERAPKGLIWRSMFPPSPPPPTPAPRPPSQPLPLPLPATPSQNTNTEDDRLVASLTQCLRVPPHHNNAGGFFVALLTKTERPGGRSRREMETDREGRAYEFRELSEEEKREEEKSFLALTHAHQTGRYKTFISFRYQPVRHHDPEWQAIRRCWGLHGAETEGEAGGGGGMDDGVDGDGDLCRSADVSIGGYPLYWWIDCYGAPKRLVAVSPRLSDYLLSRLAFKRRKLAIPAIVTLGLRVLERFPEGFLVDCECRWRAAQESTHLLASHSSHRKVRMTPRLLIKLLRERHILASELPALEESGEVEGTDKGELPIGAVLVGLMMPAEGRHELRRVWVVGMLTLRSIQVYSEKEEAASILQMLEHFFPEHSSDQQQQMANGPSETHE